MLKNFLQIRKYTLFFLFIVLSLSLSHQCRAEIDSTHLQKNQLLNTNKDKIIELDTISVVDRKNNKVFTSHFSFSVIKSSEWLGTNKTLADIISEQTGIQTRRYGGSGSFQTISIRGVEGKEVLVFLDGIPLNSSMGGAVDLSTINPENIEEIEIYKSIIPAKFGGNSLGGVINLKSKRDGTSSKIKNLLTIKGGAYGYKEASLNSIGKIKNNITLFSGINYISSDNNWNYLDRNKTPYNLTDDKISKVENHKYTAFDVMVNPTFLLPNDKEWHILFFLDLRNTRHRRFC
ncbi:MAG: TonB-dependent receptor plug domain-containing protein [Chitinispirillaceae bacterium]|nr:TonB-dependent receptor plug domain-containing protein [Chitinispirillaceae bacterium]